MAGMETPIPMPKPLPNEPVMDDPLQPEPKFWQYLSQVGALDPELVDEYRSASPRPWRQLGEILFGDDAAGGHIE